MRRPTPHPATPASRRSAYAGPARAILLTVLGLVLLQVAVLPAPAALAHADLTRSDPASGAKLAQPPEQLTLEFSEDLLPETVTVVATVTGGEPLALPEPSVEANIARVAWPATAPGADYTVSYRVVSQDGHPITGSITFSYTGGAATGSGTPSEPTQGTPTATASPATTSGDPAATTGTPAAPTAGGGSGDPTGSVITIVAAIAVLLAVAVGVWVVARARGAAR